MKRKYKVLNKNNFTYKEYVITPIRDQDRFDIMKWRNEQMFHLRQENILTEKEQDHYFNSEIRGLFDNRFPAQILFSFLKQNECIGYGGLVHIDWERKKAEISFLIDTKLEDDFFEILWIIFLKLIERVAFDHLNFNKIYTYSYAVRPKLYRALKSQSFISEQQIKSAVKINNNWVDTWIHSKYRTVLSYRDATFEDSDQLFKWANESSNRKNSLNTAIISREEHQEWFKLKLASSNKSKIFIFFLNDPIGVLRLDKTKQGERISFSVDKKHRGKGYGYRMINQIVKDFPELDFTAEVLSENESSHKIFLKNGFKFLKKTNKHNTTVVKYQKLNNG